MGNQPSSSADEQDQRHHKKSSSRRKRSSKNGIPNSAESTSNDPLDTVRDLSNSLQRGIRKLEENDHPAAQLLDTVCGPYLDPQNFEASETYSDEEDDVDEDENTTLASRSLKSSERKSSARKGRSSSYNHRNDAYSVDMASSRSYNTSYDETEYSQEDNETNVTDHPTRASNPPRHHQQQPLASSFAKRCYFTKGGIAPNTQHYEGLTLTGNVVLMLAGAMKLKGCPTICDEDLRRVEQTYPNQFSRLPDELLLSSGWRRISKYCHFSNKPIPDGVPFFHSRERIDQQGYYFLLASAVGMIRPMDVEPLNRDHLVLLETDFPQACDAAPSQLVTDPMEWVLVEKFCFFSGGPINTDEDVYYQADFDGNPIYMLAFLSPSLTPEDLYKLNDPIGLESVHAVNQVEQVYDLTERDFEDLRLYHLGPCRALPQYMLQPQAWTKVLPPYFVMAKQQALMRANDYNGGEEPLPFDEQHQQTPKLDPPVMDADDQDEPPSLHFRHEPRQLHKGLDEYHYEQQGEGVSSPTYTAQSSMDESTAMLVQPSIDDEYTAPTLMQGPSVDHGEPSSLPPRSPLVSSNVGPSSAMRGAQELIRRNRLKRLSESGVPSSSNMAFPDSPSTAISSRIPIDDEGAVSVTSSMIDGSNVSLSEPKSTRRALILQMAKARMKKSNTSSVAVEEEEKKTSDEIDLTGDLD